MALTGLVAQEGAGRERVPGVHFFPFSYCADCPLGLRRDTCATNCVELPRALAARPARRHPAAGGRDPGDGAGRGRCRARRTASSCGGCAALTRELDIPLIVDEVQTGCGRTGTWFAFEQYGIEPDVIVASKALSGIGLPVAVIIYDERLDIWAPGAHTGTFRGNQLAFAAGAEAVRIVRRDDVLGNVRARAAQIRDRLDVLRAHPWVRDVRGRGSDVGHRAGRPGDRPAGERARRAGAGRCAARAA